MEHIIGDLAARYNTAQAELASMRLDLGQAQWDAHARVELNECREELAGLHKKLADSIHQAESSRRAAEHHASELAKLREARDMSARSVETFTKGSDRIQRKLDVATAELNEVHAQLDESQRTCVRIERDRVDLAKEVARLTEELKAKEREQPGPRDGDVSAEPSGQ